MRKVRYLLVLVITAVFITVICVTSCVHKPYPVPVDNGYPPEIATIMINRCATAGCHDAASYQNADNLLLDTWDHLFNGGTNGAVVVPYSTTYSSLLYFINTDSSLGTVALPTMPTAMPYLTKDEYMTFYNWIAKGAPDKNGNIPFASNPDTRQKIYLTQQGCDLLAVIDAQRQVVMRYIPIGTDPAAIESPHCVRISSDGMYAYVSFLAGNYVQKIDTRTDAVIGAANVGSQIPGGSGGSWNIVYLSPGDTALETSDWEGNGLITQVNTNSMTVTPGTTNSGSGLFVYPHGITSNITFDTFFVTAQYGNTIYKVAFDGSYYKTLSLDGNLPATTNNLDSSSPNPHEILMAPDYSKYFVTCQSTNQVKVIDAHTNAILATIPVGIFPQEIAISTTQPYIFVTCQEDVSTFSGRKGSVYVINYNTFEIVKRLDGDFYQPHGVTVDDKDGLVFIASTNANPNGPAPHHATACAGRDGWYTVFNLNTLTAANNTRYEVTVMPYSAATRFK